VVAAQRAEGQHERYAQDVVGGAAQLCALLSRHGGRVNRAGIQILDLLSGVDGVADVAPVLVDGGCSAGTSSQAGRAEWRAARTDHATGFHVDHARVRTMAYKQRK
jgi:hypothetical protein